MHGMAFMFKICILYNSKVSLMSKVLGTNAVIVKRVHCTYIFVMLRDTWQKVC